MESQSLTGFDKCFLMKLDNRKGRQQKWEREYKDIECQGLKKEKAVFKSHG